MRFQDKTVVVTGGSRGIGKAIALGFAKEGANVVVNYTSSPDRAEEVVEAIRALGSEAEAVKCDVSNADEVKELVKFAEDKFSKVDVLINNAGITRDGLLLRMNEGDWDAVLDTNLKGVFLCTKLFGKKMLKQKSGKIVNISSVVGISGNAGQANYSASKAGVIGFTKSVAKEFASRGINVNAVAPGFIRTEMTDKLSEEVINKYSEAIPFKKMGEAEDIAKAVMFLCSEDSKYITGQVLNVDGGMLM